MTSGSMVIWERLHNFKKFPMPLCVYVLACVRACVSFLGPLAPTHLPPPFPSSTSSITLRLHHTLSPSLAFISGLVEFPGQLRRPVRVSILHHYTHTHTHCRAGLTSLFSLSLLPDCNSSVHKSCRDSLPACAKVKMKVKVPRVAPAADPAPVVVSIDLKLLIPPLLSSRFSGQPPKQQCAVPDSSSLPAVTMRNKCE